MGGTRSSGSSGPSSGTYSGSIRWESVFSIVESKDEQAATTDDIENFSSKIDQDGDPELAESKDKQAEKTEDIEKFSIDATKAEKTDDFENLSACIACCCMCFLLV